VPQQFDEAVGKGPEQSSSERADVRVMQTCLMLTPQVIYLSRKLQSSAQGLSNGWSPGAFQTAGSEQYLRMGPSRAVC
jgi:hypothetical protein